MRLRQTSNRSEASYLHYIVDFIRFHGKRHARELGVGEIRAYLSHQATENDGAASTQNMALSALLFLYRRVPGLAVAAGGESPDDYHWICAKCYGGMRYMRRSQNSPSLTFDERSSRAGSVALKPCPSRQQNGSSRAAIGAEPGQTMMNVDQRSPFR
jgi:hypothetical protein